jgi:hypothetical protein
VAASVLTNVVALRNERRRQRQAEREARVAEVNSRTKDAFKQLFAIQHSIEWVTWHAKHDPESIRNPKLVASYDKEIHQAYPAFLGALAAANAISDTVYEDLRQLLDHVYTIEHNVALALKEAQRSDAQFATAIVALTKYYEEITNLLEHLLTRLPEVMERATISER